MTFRELLVKYKSGTLSENEKIMVEQELEKSEAINDYLTDEIEKSLGLNYDNEHKQNSAFKHSNLSKQNNYQNTAGINIKDSDEITRHIKKTVNKRLASVVGLSVACMLIIILIMQFIISPLVSTQYYNPTKKTLGQEYFQDFKYDLKAITTVSMPGFGVSGIVNAEDLGFGEYNLIYSRRNLFTNEDEIINKKVGKVNKRIGVGLYPRAYFAFCEFWDNEEGTAEYEESLNFSKTFTENRYIEYLKELPSTSYVSGWVRFPKDLSMRELVKTMERHGGTDFKWIAVRTSENQGRQLMGFSTGLNDSSDGEIIDEEKYPGFHLVDTMKLIPTKPKEEVMSQRYKMHFVSMLKYLTDRKEAVAALTGINATIEYEDALKYIEENGMSTYGALVYGEADDLLKLYESGDIMTFYIDNVVSSKYMNRILYY